MSKKLPLLNLRKKPYEIIINVILMEFLYFLTQLLANITYTFCYANFSTFCSS